MLTPRNDPATFQMEFVGVFVIAILCMIAYLQALKKHGSSSRFLFYIHDIFILFYLACLIIYIRELILLWILFILYIVYSYLFKKQLRNIFTNNDIDVDSTNESLKSKLEPFPFGFLIISDTLEQILVCVFIYGFAYYSQSINIPLYIFYIVFYVLWCFITYKRFFQILFRKKGA